MFLKYLRVFLGILVLTLFATGCASRGRPSGGEKDITPPEITGEKPENYSTNFISKEIKIYFNEYVKLKDLQKQLIVSPPMDTPPVITPLGSASKYITVKIEDTLEANTTYAINFGQSIVDNNEENPYPYYRYVFSTGETIDSLSVKGAVFDALNRNADPFVSVMLYEADTSYIDSIVYKQKPKFITNTLDSLVTFSIDNIKAGKYRLVALKEENSNFTFQPKTDKIGFYEGEISVPTEEIFDITLFKEVPDFKVLKPSQIAEQRILFPYEGELEDVAIEIQSDSIKNIDYRLTRDKETDSLYYWYKPKIEIDSASILVKSKNFTETFKYKFRNADKDSLVISALKPGTISFNEDITLIASTPFAKIDTTKIKLINKDSVNVKYAIEYDKLYNRYAFKIDKQQSEKYKIQLLPSAITDFYGAVNDTLDFAFSTRKKADFGNIRVTLINAKLPLIVQLVDDRGEVKYEKYAEEIPIVDFNDIDARKYSIRAIFDTNKNKKFDSGNYLKKLQPEKVSYHPDIIDVRPNFDYDETLTLRD
ncbi:MAG: Ig-like domain-containing protein [Winogradskyella sp.]|uniref:Ig-like domain-containing protein n=1 Tax=Winogradskyella sp. TaxID=1883156 RepID=UPI0017D8D163|nr:Ig-like domain-containing protein [Winogradskyella sp.]MBT8245677.1 Ig-like domain-containing protein [Winogradskyella sp.]NNK22003.1 Ig-like domain-containing protein [Winogradskyella sp.]